MHKTQLKNILRSQNLIATLSFLIGNFKLVNASIISKFDISTNNQKGIEQDLDRVRKTNQSSRSMHIYNKEIQVLTEREREISVYQVQKKTW